MADNVEDSWDKFLNPEMLRANLIAASIFITGYEILKSAIVDQLKSFYSIGFDESGPTISEDYELKVISLDSKRNVFRASIAWLLLNDVITTADKQAILDLTEHRNQLAHQLPKFLADSGKNVELARLEKLIELVAKIDRWWIINVELAIRDDLDANEVPPKEITSGNMIFLHLLVTTASGADSGELYRQWREKVIAQKKV
ncbi:MAG TPA: hypothetical protein VF773_02920 [Verrucomicrobiae bacterium]